MNSMLLIDLITYHLFSFLIFGSFISNFFLKKVSQNINISVLNKFLISPDLASPFNVLFFYYIQLIFLYTWKGNMPSFLLTPFVVKSLFIFIFINIFILELSIIFKLMISERVVVIQTSLLLTLAIQLFSLVDNFLTLLFSIELINIIYLFFLLDSSNLSVGSLNRYKHLISTYLWNSFFVLLLFIIFTFLISYYIGSLNFIEVNILHKSILNYVHVILILAITWKVGAPGFHFFKYELYKYFSTTSLILFSGYTLFINFFILSFILFMFKPVLVANLTLFYTYILISNIIILCKGYRISTLCVFLALSSLNTWCTVFIFGLLKCYYK